MEIVNLFIFNYNECVYCWLQQIELKILGNYCSSVNKTWILELGDSLLITVSIFSLMRELPSNRMAILLKFGIIWNYGICASSVLRCRNERILSLLWALFSFLVQVENMLLTVMQGSSFPKILRIFIVSHIFIGN